MDVADYWNRKNVFGYFIDFPSIYIRERFFLYQINQVLLPPPTRGYIVSYMYNAILYRIIIVRQ